MIRTLRNEEFYPIYKQLVEADKTYIPDAWQKKVLEHKGNAALRTGRQVGKSETVGRKAADLCIEYSGITVLMIAAAQRQSSEIFQKTLRRLNALHEVLIKRAGGYKYNSKLSARQNDDHRRKFEYKYGMFESLPTKTEAKLKNGTRLLSLPTGKTGTYIRCYTVDVLIADEASFIPEPVWVAIRPMLATSKKMRGLGWEILLSTPFGKGGHYYNCCFDDDYLQIHVSSEDCPRIAKEFLAKEKKRLTKLEYAQEYLGEFVDEFNQFFKTDLIKRRMDFIGWDFKTGYNKNLRYYLGVDIARYGADETALVIAEMDGKDFIKVVYVETVTQVSIPTTVGRILALDSKFNFRKIFVDSAGVGGGAYDLLLEKLSRSKVIGLENSTKTVDEEKKKGILKEDLYSNALVLMERDSPHKISIVSNLKLLRSLKSMQFEYTSDKNLRIYGRYSHLAEAFVRALWCRKAKGLKLFVG